MFVKRYIKKSNRLLSERVSCKFSNTLRHQKRKKMQYFSYKDPIPALGKPNVVSSLVQVVYNKTSAKQTAPSRFGFVSMPLGQNKRCKTISLIQCIGFNEIVSLFGLPDCFSDLHLRARYAQRTQTKTSSL